MIDKSIIAEHVNVGDNVTLGIGSDIPNKLKPNIYSFGLVTIGENSVKMCIRDRRWNWGRKFR